MKSYIVTRSEAGPLIGFVASKLGISRSKAKQVLDSRSVFVNGKRLWMAQSDLRAGDEVEIHVGSGSAAEKVQITKDLIVFRDESILVINKPPGILSNGESGSVEHQLKELLDSKDIYATHRIDRDTSGCLMFAFGDKARGKCEELFRHRKIDKIYHAVALGKVPSHFEAIRTPIDGRPACTKLTVLKSTNKASHLRLKLETGRMHQIRKHLASIRHPVLGDKEYYRLPLPPELVAIAPRQLLHSKSIKLSHPITGEELFIEAPLPKDFKRAISTLKIV